MPTAYASKTPNRAGSWSWTFRPLPTARRCSICTRIRLVLMTFRFLVCEPQCVRRSWNRSRRNGEEKGQGREKDVDLFALLGIGRRVDTILHHGHCLTYSHLQQHHTQHAYSLSRPPVSVYTVFNTISHHTCCLHTRRELGRRDRQTDRQTEREKERGRAR